MICWKNASHPDCLACSFIPERVMMSQSDVILIWLYLFRIRSSSSSREVEKRSSYEKAARLHLSLYHTHPAFTYVEADEKAAVFLHFPLAYTIEEIVYSACGIWKIF